MNIRICHEAFDRSDTKPWSAYKLENSRWLVDPWKTTNTFFLNHEKLMVELRSRLK